MDDLVMNIELIGWVATILFAISALPQAIKAYKDGHSEGVSSLLLAFWYVGEALMTWYTLVKYTNDYILLINYGANLILLTVIIRYKMFPRSSKSFQITQTHCENDVVCYTVSDTEE